MLAFCGSILCHYALIDHLRYASLALFSHLYTLQWISNESDTMTVWISLLHLILHRIPGPIVFQRSHIGFSSLFQYFHSAGVLRGSLLSDAADYAYEQHSPITALFSAWVWPDILANCNCCHQSTCCDSCPNVVGLVQTNPLCICWWFRL